MATNAEMSKAWREANPEKWKQSRRKYYMNNKDEIKASRNKEKDRTRSLAYIKNLPPDKLAKTKERVKIFSKEQRLRRRMVIDQVKLQNKCQNPTCQWTGDFESCDLDFHHIEGATKYKSVALLLNSSAKKIIAEISKCVVLCAICHRRVTHKKLDCSGLSPCQFSIAKSDLK